MTARYVGLWHGGANYSAPSADDAEYFDSIREAIDAMRSRERVGYWQSQRFRYVLRGTAHDLTPCAHDDGSGGMWLYRIDPGMSPDAILRMIESDGYPDRIIEYGPRGGIVVNPA